VSLSLVAAELPFTGVDMAVGLEVVVSVAIPFTGVDMTVGLEVVVSVAIGSKSLA